MGHTRTLTHLPIDSFLDDIVSRLQSTSGLVLTAEPGAGKTTRLPPALLKTFPGRILVLEPRRMAAAAAAHRVAEEQGWELGNQVGYQVRFDNRTTPSTRLIYMTEALLSRRIMNESEMNEVSVVVLDEFHERSIHVDLALGLLRELQLLGYPLKILVMSATLDASPIAEFLGEVPTVAVPGQLFPLTIEHQTQALRLKTDPDFYKLLLQGIRRAVHSTTDDILVFLPGTGEIRRAQEALSERQEFPSVEILHGSLSLTDQQAVLKRKSQRRIILSTNIAESSLTLDGVSAVVDCGLARIMRHDLKSGFSRLEMGRIARANADQRAGRAARQKPGFCFRMWAKTESASMIAQEVPEILRGDLSETLLVLSAQGVTQFSAFNWFQSPSPAQIQRAQRELVSLGAIEANGGITELGRKILTWPLPPRLAKLMCNSIEMGCPTLGADLSAILSERDFLRPGEVANHLADNWECDLAIRLDILKNFRIGKSKQGVDQIAIRSVIKLSEQLRNRIKGLDKNSETTSVAKILLKTFPDRLARRRGSSGRGILVGGRGLAISPNSLVKTSPFFLALSGVDFENSADSTVHLATGLDKSRVLQDLADEIVEQSICEYDRDQKRFFELRQKCIQDLVIEQSQPKPASSSKVKESLPEILLKELPWLERNNRGLARWFQRWNYFQQNHQLPVLPILAVKTALGQAAGDQVDFEKIAQLDLASAMNQCLEYSTRQKMDSEVPERLQVPSGSWIEVEYPTGGSPFLAVRLQELFGLKSSPTIMNGKVPLVLHLLAPNFRPVQQTADLKSFWANGYFEVRKELRSRYPKHSWPEDPLTAIPHAKGRRRSSP